MPGVERPRRNAEKAIPLAEAHHETADDILVDENEKNSPVKEFRDRAIPVRTVRECHKLLLLAGDPDNTPSSGDRNGKDFGAVWHDSPAIPPNDGRTPVISHRNTCPAAYIIVS
ncbi:MAG: hypothetical protein OEU46_07680 [Alphaproteobacteria bacterium]|nr:hypothetical protein [Alphaproteobacteria bacterium]